MKNPILLKILLNQKEKNLSYIHESFKYGEVKASEVKELIPETGLISIQFDFFGRETRIFLNDSSRHRIKNFDQEYEKIENKYVRTLGIIDDYFMMSLY